MPLGWVLRYTASLRGLSPVFGEVRGAFRKFDFGLCLRLLPPESLGGIHQQFIFFLFNCGKIGRTKFIV